MYIYEIYIYIYLSIYVWLYICVCVCVSTYIYIYIHIHIHIHTHIHIYLHIRCTCIYNLAFPVVHTVAVLYMLRPYVACTHARTHARALHQTKHAAIYRKWKSSRVKYSTYARRRLVVHVRRHTLHEYGRYSRSKWHQQCRQNWPVSVWQVFLVIFGALESVSVLRRLRN